MRSPSIGTASESFEKSGRSSDGQIFARDLYKQRKSYGNSVNSTEEVSEYKVAVRIYYSNCF